MLPEQRHSLILERIQQNGGVSVAELADQFDVSASTIRRDLNLMDREGMLRRVRGGGTTEPDARPFHVVASTASTDRLNIGKMAASIVQDRQVVILDIGATAAMVARELRNRQITVVTSSLAVVDELRDCPQTEVVVLGGIIRHSYLSLVGPLTENALAGLNADIAFLGTSGITDGLTVLDSTGAEVPIKQLILRNSNESYLLATKDKFPGSGILPVCSATDFTGIITSADPSTPALQKLRQTNTKVTIV